MALSLAQKLGGMFIPGGEENKPMKSKQANVIIVLCICIYIYIHR